MHRRPPVASFCFPLAAALAAALAAQGPPVLAHWALDETTGTTARDSGPFANQGTLVNFGAAPWVAGQLVNALQFDGVDDHVAIAANGGLPVYRGLGSPFTVAFWVKAPAQADRRVYSEQAAAPSGGGPLFTLGSGSGDAVANTKLRMFVRSDAVINVVNQLSNAVVFDDSWHHVAYVDESGRVRLYVDGVLDSAFDYSRWSYGPLSTLRATFAQIDSVTLGAVVRNQAVATPLLGIVDDLWVLRGALSAGDVIVLQFGGPPSVCNGSLGGYGLGCGAGPLDLVATGGARHGDTIWTQLVRGTPGNLAVMCIAAGELQPVSLSPFGFAGCTLYGASPSCTIFGVLGPAGSSPVFSLLVPGTASLSCRFVNLQGGALGLAVELSPAALAQIGF